MKRFLIFVPLLIISFIVAAAGSNNLPAAGRNPPPTKREPVPPVIVLPPNRPPLQTIESSQYKKLMKELKSNVANAFGRDDDWLSLLNVAIDRLDYFEAKQILWSLNNSEPTIEWWRFDYLKRHLRSMSDQDIKDAMRQYKILRGLMPKLNNHEAGQAIKMFMRKLRPEIIAVMRAERYKRLIERSENLLEFIDQLKNVLADFTQPVLHLLDEGCTDLHSSRTSIDYLHNNVIGDHFDLYGTYNQAAFIVNKGRHKNANARIDRLSMQGAIKLHKSCDMESAPVQDQVAVTLRTVGARAAVIPASSKSGDQFIPTLIEVQSPRHEIYRVERLRDSTGSLHPKKLSPPGAPKEPVPPAVAQSPPPVAAHRVILFGLNQATLNVEELDVIRKAAENAKRVAGRVQVTGHTDRSGSRHYNMRLSILRAKAVAVALVQLGLRNDQIISEGRGEAEPVNPTADGVIDLRNRRVVINVF